MAAEPGTPPRAFTKVVLLRQSLRRDADTLVVLVAATPLLATFGSSRWSWLAGPVSSLAIHALGHDQNETEDRVPQTRGRRSYRQKVSSAGIVSRRQIISSKVTRLKRHADYV
jgi:hypothetical protein